jgi:hypothetical protein
VSLFESTAPLLMQSDIPAPIAPSHSIGTKPVTNTRRKALLAACVGHQLYGGYTDLIYVMLPIWQTSFGLDTAAWQSFAHCISEQQRDCSSPPTLWQNPPAAK